MRTPTIQSPSADFINPTERVKEIFVDLSKLGTTSITPLHDEFIFNIQNVPPEDVPKVRKLIEELQEEYHRKFVQSVEQRGQ